MCVEVEAIGRPLGGYWEVFPNLKSMPPNPQARQARPVFLGSLSKTVSMRSTGLELVQAMHLRDHRFETFSPPGVPAYAPHSFRNETIPEKSQI